MSPRDLVWVSLCCNDDRGNCAGRVRKVDIDDDGELIELESPWWSENDYDRVFPSVRIEARHVRVGHARLLVSRDRDWYGNIFWHGFEVFADDARKLVRYLTETRGFQVIAAPVESRFLPSAR